MKSVLFENQDLEYKAFHQKLIPNISPDRVIGVRTPTLRKIAKEFCGTKDREQFLQKLPHEYYEENNLHAFFIEQIKDFELCITEINRFLPHIDNWATCDGMRPKCCAKNKDKLLLEIEKWLGSKDTYTVRYGIEMLMVHFLDENFDEKYLDMVTTIRSDEYYINMMIAWYFATALAKRWDETFPYIKNKQMPVWIHNKTIQKSIESYRITDEEKAILRRLKIKEF